MGLLDAPGLSKSQASAAFVGGGAGRRVPPGWGANWKAKLATAGSTLVKVGIQGTSITYGAHVSNPRTKSWPALVAANLQATYGDGGSGFYGSVSTTLGGVLRGVPAAISTAWQANDAYWTLTGTWACTQADYGPGGHYISTSGLGATATIKNVRGTSIKVYTLSNSGGNAAWTYSIDGAAAVPVADGAAFRVQVTTIAVSAGTHTITITQNETGKNFFIIGVAGYNATGVVVDNFAYFGSRSDGWLTFTPQIGAGLWSGSSSNPVDLLICETGANDANASPAIGTGVTLTAAASAGQNTLTVSGALSPGFYRLDNEAIYVEYMNGLSAVLSRKMAVGHASGATMLASLRTPTSLGTNLSASITQARETTPACDTVVLASHIGTYNGFGLWSAYHDAMRNVADQTDAAFVSMWAAGRTSWAYWNGLGYWGSVSTAGVAGTDSIHLSDAGAAAYAAQMLATIA